LSTGYTLTLDSLKLHSMLVDHDALVLDRGRGHDGRLSDRAAIVGFSCTEIVSLGE
jgi:hypothetical protein